MPAIARTVRDQATDRIAQIDRTFLVANQANQVSPESVTDPIVPVAPALAIVPAAPALATVPAVRTDLEQGIALVAHRMSGPR